MQVTDLFLGLGESLVGKTCGFLGLGKIGLATARRHYKQTEISTKKQIFGFSRLLLFCCSVENAFRLLPFGISRLIYTNRSQSELASQVIPFWGDVSL